MVAANLFPIHDWQFWAASAIVLVVVAVPVWRVLRRQGKAGRKRAGRTKATLTIGGKPMRK